MVQEAGDGVCDGNHIVDYGSAVVYAPHTSNYEEQTFQSPIACLLSQGPGA